MATDTRTDTSMTLAELCQAIAEGDLSYALHDDHYYVKANDVRRIRSAKQPTHDMPPSDLLVQPGSDTSSLNVGCSA